MWRLVFVGCAALAGCGCVAGDRETGPSSAPPSTPAVETTVDQAADESADERVLDDELAGGPVIERVQVESVRFPGRLWDPFLPPMGEGSPVRVDGWLSLPPGRGEVPAVVIVQGCGGLGSAEQDWAQWLADEGIATAALDSFGGRGVTEICSGRETLNVADLIVDLYRVADVVRDHPSVDGDRVAVMGFSFGGRTALWSALDRFQDAYGGRPLRGHIAFYPSTCFIRLENEAEVVGGPIRIFHGAADDWTPVEPCQDHVDRLASVGVDAAVFRYADAHHAFDNRSLAWGLRHYSPSLVSPRHCRFVERDGVIIDPDIGTVAGVDSPCVELGASYGYDAEARAAAEQDLRGFLDLIFSSS